ncbi:MscS Mechanosensitive ion channel [Candidatus Moduliflexus flocculans]|uniref:MscS Mechanosensitive ion channel n=1 Tax=Candidatus Moduliflexus flocculans TaxID=1499966 RepID=A0A081BQ02_9BACT|nr:MscS Mechanosensitive ion channel [Candidatus Moduliflexus flocculans]
MIYHRIRFWFIVVLVLAAIRSPLPAFAQPGVPTLTPAPTQNLDLNTSLSRTLIAEQQRKVSLDRELQHIEQLALNAETEIHTYAIQLSTYNNLLLVENISAEELQKVQKETRGILDVLNSKIKEAQEVSASSKQAGFTLYEQYTQNQQQLEDIRAAIRTKGTPDPQTQRLVATLEKVTSALEQNYHAAEKIQDAYNELLDRIQKIYAEFRALDERVSGQLETRKKQELLERNPDITGLLSSEQFLQDMKRLRMPLEVIRNAGGIVQALRQFLGRYGLNIGKIALFLLLVEPLMLKFRSFLKKLAFTTTFAQYPCRNLLFHILDHSFPFLEIGLCLLAYQSLEQDEVMIMLINIIVTVLLLILLYRWMADVVSFWSRDARDKRVLRCLKHVRRLMSAIPFITISNLFLHLLLGNSSLILLLERFALEILAVVWTLMFSKRMADLPPGHAYFTTDPKRQQTIDTMLVGLAYMISTGGLLMELAGYAAFVRYWYNGWLRTLGISLWGFLLFAVIQEWEQHVKTMDMAEQSGKLHQIEWLVFRLSWFLLPILVFTQLLIAWGEKDIVKTNLLKILSYPIPLGSSMHFSILRLVYGGIVLILVNFLVRTWRWVLAQRILVGSGLQKGMQASITTLSVYGIWLFGLMIALNAIGVDTATLTVAFGALGIGIGFGLQSIFNNFISGLILLFERPIEVGHVLEINGVWGQVETINVRSTVIRTFDNSAIIIPNADIISNQVTNWTFQDARMRRAIKVGVAYGSDPKLVEQTLYEIAQKHPRVLTNPAPLVHFSDFGENALLFILRFWTLLDYGVPTETEIRIEIDRTFKEKNIVIAFPQLDVHLYREQTKADEDVGGTGFPSNL